VRIASIGDEREAARATVEQRIDGGREPLRVDRHECRCDDLGQRDDEVRRAGGGDRRGERCITRADVARRSLRRECEPARQVAGGASRGQRVDIERCVRRGRRRGVPQPQAVARREPARFARVVLRCGKEEHLDLVGNACEATRVVAIDAQRAKRSPDRRAGRRCRESRRRREPQVPARRMRRDEGEAIACEMRRQPRGERRRLIARQVVDARRDEHVVDAGDERHRIGDEPVARRGIEAGAVRHQRGGRRRDADRIDQRMLEPGVVAVVLREGGKAREPARAREHVGGERGEARRGDDEMCRTRRAAIRGGVHRPRTLACDNRRAASTIACRVTPPSARRFAAHRD
jgi:hypothetical protein